MDNKRQFHASNNAGKKTLIPFCIDTSRHIGQRWRPRAHKEDVQR